METGYVTRLSPDRMGCLAAMGGLGGAVSRGAPSVRGGRVSRYRL